MSHAELTHARCFNNKPLMSFHLNGMIYSRGSRCRASTATVLLVTPPVPALVAADWPNTPDSGNQQRVGQG